MSFFPAFLPSGSDFLFLRFRASTHSRAFFSSGVGAIASANVSLCLWHYCHSSCRCMQTDQTWQTGEGTCESFCESQARSLPWLQLVEREAWPLIQHLVPQCRLSAIVLPSSMSQSEAPFSPSFRSHVKDVYRPLSHAAVSLCPVEPPIQNIEGLPELITLIFHICIFSIGISNNLVFPSTLGASTCRSP